MKLTDLPEDKPRWTVPAGDYANQRTDARIAALERELAEARAQFERVKAMDREDFIEEHEARLKAEAEVEAAARWFYDAGQTSGADNERYGNGEYFDAAWSRYQQEHEVTSQKEGQHE